MDAVQIDLDFNGKELVILSLLSNLGVAALKQDAKAGALILRTISELDGAKQVAETAMEKLYAAMSIAETQLAAKDRTVWS